MKTTPAPNQKKQENIFLNLAFNIAIPALILSKASSEAYLGPTWALVAALVFPLGYGLFDFFGAGRTNFVSILGFVSVLLTGGLGLLQVDGFWFAVKEAAIPSLIGVVVIGSVFAKKPLIRTIFFNENVINTHRVEQALEIRGKNKEFEGLLASATWLLAASLFLSAVLNFALAIYILKSPAGTEEFNVELGRMTALSYPVIVVPCTVVAGFAMWKLISGVKKLTGLELEAIFDQGDK